jgi:hypothetical protein
MKTIFKMASIAALAAAACVNSQALTVSPGTEVASGIQTGVPAIYAEIAANYPAYATYVNASGELYKQNAGEGSDSGGFAGSYTTSFTPNAGDASGFTIDYISGAAISTSPIYLLVKDGNQNPAWYLFDITGWNGTDDIVGSGFWPQQGAISHVSIYGPAGRTNVPDGGATLLLLGSAVAGSKRPPASAGGLFFWS